jgi:hypothetical protein
VKEEMEHLVESESTDRVSYYAAFLQRLIWVESPELFQLPPEPSVAAAPTALCVRMEQGSNRATIQENQKRCSESGIHKAESSSEQIDMASKKIYLGVRKKQKCCSESHMQEIEARSKKTDTASLIIDAGDMEEVKIYARARQLGEKEGKLDARSEQLGEQEGPEGKLDAGTEQLSKKDSGMQAESLSRAALVTKEKETNDELQCVRKILTEVTREPITPFMDACVSYF